MQEILPEIQNSLQFIGNAAAGGIIGNRVDSWFTNLYFHERHRILSWLQYFKVTEDDKNKINNNEHLKIMFSQVTSSVANEIFEEKLLIWPSITESLLRNESIEFDRKQFFINLFIKLDIHTLAYLSKLYFDGKMKYQTIFPDNKINKPNIDNNDFTYYLGHMQSVSTGMTDMVSDDVQTYVQISEFGREFINFISNSSKENLKNIRLKK